MRLTELRMHQCLLVKYGERPLRCPFVKCIPVHARLVSMEIWHWCAHFRMPIERHNRQVCVAHERFSDIVYAVVCVAAKVGDADIVLVMPQDLSQHT